MYSGIETKYLGATNHRGSRIIARCGSLSHPRLTVAYDDALSPGQNHANAAQKLAARAGWQGEWIGGWNASGTGAMFTSLRRERDGGCTNLIRGEFQVTEADVDPRPVNAK